MSLAVIDNEHQARLYGRARAKEIFQPLRWKRIGTFSDEAANLYESAKQASSNESKRRYSLRAVKPLRASLAEVEAVLTGQTALLRKDDAPSLLARLLPATYVSGGGIVQFPTLDHLTSERENVSLEYTRLKPYAARKQQDNPKNAELVESMENYVLLGYTLSTKLQRSDTSKRKNLSIVTSSVPSLLHLYRPVNAPTFAARRRDFKAERLAINDFSITYIVQEMPLSQEAGNQQESEQTVTLEVVLTCSMDVKQVEVVVDEENDNLKEVEWQQKQRIRHDVLCLTRLQPFIDAYRQEKYIRPRHYPNQLREPQHDPKNCDPNMLRGSMFAGGRACGVCHRKFGPFRWKRHCEACEKLVCNQCISVVAAAPLLSRRKKRMCSQCLYNETANVAAMHKAAAETAHNNEKNVGSFGGSAKSNALNETTRINAFPSLDTLITKHKSSRKTACVEIGASLETSGRVQIDFGLDPTLVSSFAETPDRRRARSRQSQFSQGSVVSTISNASSTSNFVAVTYDNRRATLPSHIDLYDVESAVAKSMRSRRAKTVLLDDTKNMPVAVTPKARSFITSLSSLPPTDDLCSMSTDKVEYEAKQQQKVVRPCASSCRTCNNQSIQLKTPEPDYELDFNWYNTFPKAPVERTAEELARAKYVEVTGLKLDDRLLMFLRHDKALADLASRVLHVASQWNTCSINIVGSNEVYCLVTVFNKPQPLDLDYDMLELEASPVVVDDVVSREKSVSSYVVYHQSHFFVGDLEHDLRFRAHPLHTEQRAVSLLSFPINSSGASGSLDQGETYCVATLDLWKRDRVPASSHVSHDWVSNMHDLLRKISARLEAVALELHTRFKPCAPANHLFESSYDSIGTVRPADSIIDTYNIGNESVIDLPSYSHAETMDRLTRLSYAKVRGTGLGGIGGPGSSTWKYNSDNESTTSSQSASSTCSQSSRFSSHLYSAADMHSTIESLLKQASKTSQYINETGVFI